MKKGNGMKINPLLLCDWYKVVHSDMYPKTVTKLVSYFTPRMSRLEDEEKLVMFGLQAFIKTYLIDGFSENFFSRPKDEVLAEYARIVDNGLGKESYNIHKVEELYDLGYLPLEIRALPEGCRVNIKVPMFEISNTHPKFTWLVNTIESAISATLWHAMVSANVGVMYRNIVNKYYEKTVDDNVPRARALGDFSFRGQESIEGAIMSSAGFCLSFLNTATVPAIPWLEKNYNCDCAKEPVAFGAISTEHSVMCSNYAIDGDEITFFRRMLTEIYPHHSFSIVSDSYDYWNVVDNIIPQLKEEILNHDGCLLVRGDSGDPVEIVTETVFHLWETFGGTINSKGYKVLDPHIKAIYGDSITPERCERIFEILTQNGFACNNVSLGVGSFSMQCLENTIPFSGAETGDQADALTVYQPYTRDTFGIAIKATYAEDEKGNPIMIFKNPKTDNGHFKKSQRGCCSVHFNGKDFSCQDGMSFAEHNEDPMNVMIPVFRNGKMLKEYTLSDIRNILWLGTF